MVDRQPFDSQPSFVYQHVDQLPPEFFDQADGPPRSQVSEQWTGEPPQPYGPSEDASEDGYASQQHTGVTPRWPSRYHPAVDANDAVAWDGNQDELANQLYPPTYTTGTYTTGTPFPSHVAHSDTSSPIAYYQPSSTLCHDYQQPWSIPYAQPDHYSDTTPSDQSCTTTTTTTTTTTNSDKTHRPTQHQPNHAGDSRDTRPSSSHHKTSKKRGEPSEGPPDPEDGPDPPQTSTHKERNRVAANKFRSRKRQGTDKLRVDEVELEKHNCHLLTSVKQLTQEVYQLKMQLLKHSDCDCTLIQNYIQSEAHRYIHGIQPPKDGAQK